jgi:hypothetical protein
MCDPMFLEVYVNSDRELLFSLELDCRAKKSVRAKPRACGYDHREASLLLSIKHNYLFKRSSLCVNPFDRCGKRLPVF